MAVKVVVDKVNVAAIDAVNWLDPDAVKAFGQTIGQTPSAAGVFATIVMGSWTLGEKAKAGNHKPDTSPFMDGFVTGRTMPGGGGALSKDTEATYRSVARTAADVASTLPYPGREIARFAGTKLGGVGFGSRAKVITDIVAAHPDAMPTTDEMAACIPEKVANVSDALAAIVKKLAAIAADDDTAKVLAAHNLIGEFQATNRAAKALAEASAKVVPVTPPKRKGKTVSELAGKLLG